jgi:DUF1680 family protein
MGEAWDNTAYEQTNPHMKRMMETCAGVTWLKFCHQMLRLTGDPRTVDYIELYAYNGLIGAMKPTGDGFSYVNLLNGVKTEPKGWGTTIDQVYVTCCNLNGPLGLAYLPLIPVMSGADGPVVNLYNAGTATVSVPTNGDTRLTIDTTYPLDGLVRIQVTPTRAHRFALKLRIPSWSRATHLSVNHQAIPVEPGTYVRIERVWSAGDEITLQLDMRCRLVRANRGSTPGSDHFQALLRGPIVLSRDENIDPHFDQPVDIISTDGFVDAKSVVPASLDANMQFAIPTSSGVISMIDYASVNSWKGKRVQTWLPIAGAIAKPSQSSRTVQSRSS